MEDGKTLEKKRKLLISSQKYFGRKCGMPGKERKLLIFQQNILINIKHNWYILPKTKRQKKKYSESIKLNIGFATLSIWLCKLTLKLLFFWKLWISGKKF